MPIQTEDGLLQLSTIGTMAANINVPTCTWTVYPSRSVMKLLPDRSLAFQETLGIGLLVNIFILELYPYPQMEQKDIDPAAYLAEISQKGTSHYRFSVTEKI